MWLNQRADCAVRLMVDLACLPQDERTTVKEVARRQNVPEPFMAKVVTQAVAAGLVETRRGTGGGLSIGRAADDINLLEIVEAVERPLTLANCTFEHSRCSLSNGCAVHPVLARVQRQLREELARTTLAELAMTQKALG